jgi:hypothetical protein
MSNNEPDDESTTDSQQESEQHLNSRVHLQTISKEPKPGSLAYLVTN